MEPTLQPGDWLLVWRGFPGGGHEARARSAPRHQPIRVRPGQIVVARHPEKPDMLLVKRAEWLDSDGWWLNSDNPQAGAVDSARFGLVEPDLIEGRVLFRYWRAR
jgi:nickel-type superoxide dismutase maturation protease